MILSSIDGEQGMFGCNILEILKNGDPSGKWLAGYQDLLAVKAAYLLALANNGVIVHSAFLRVQSGDDTAWKTV